MKTLWALSLLLLSAFAAAQTTYNVAPNPYGYPATAAKGVLQAQNVTLEGSGNQIRYAWGYTPGNEWTCSTYGGNGTGFLALTIGGVAQPCVNATSYSSTGSFPGPVCAGLPTMGTENFDNGAVLTVTFNWYYSRGCRATITGGTLVIP
jgi:hypothetical protein